MPDPDPTKPDIDDLFATLFAPATPPASTLLSIASPSIFSPPSDSRHRLALIPAASPTDSDFGAFVSVPASEDPLAPSLSSQPSPVGASARRRLNANAEFFTEARAATARNQQGLLAELLEHQDDPMYWHNKYEPSPHSSAIPSGATTPQSLQPPPQSTAAHLVAGDPLAEPVKTAMETTTIALKPLLDALNEATSDSPFAPPPSQTVSVGVTPQPQAPPSSSPIRRSPSLPPSPSRPSPPILSRIESTSTFSPASSLPSRRMTSLLTYRGPPPSTSPPARLVPKRVNITHGSPFAATPFIPASGAPGFDGDRAWNKGFDAGDDASSPERRGVQLLGRKETTRAVLGTTLADAVRPYFTRPLVFPVTDQKRKKKKKHNALNAWLPTSAPLPPPRTRAPPTLVDTAIQPRPARHLIAHALRALWRSHWWRAARCERRGRRVLWRLGGGRHTRGPRIVYRIGRIVSSPPPPQTSRSLTARHRHRFLWKARGDSVEVFKWTGQNDYVALCEPESISFGGGCAPPLALPLMSAAHLTASFLLHRDGHFGLYLDETLYEGSSARCPTFNNDPLCTPDPSRGGTATFECVGLEVWGVGPS